MTGFPELFGKCAVENEGKLLPQQMKIPVMGHNIVGNKNFIMLEPYAEVNITTVVDPKTLTLSTIKPNIDTDAYKDVIILKTMVVTKGKYYVQSTPTPTKNYAAILKPTTVYDTKLCGISTSKELFSRPNMHCSG